MTKSVVQNDIGAGVILSFRVILSGGCEAPEVEGSKIQARGSFRYALRATFRMTKRLDSSATLQDDKDRTHESCPRVFARQEFL